MKCKVQTPRPRPPHNSEHFTVDRQIFRNIQSDLWPPIRQLKLTKWPPTCSGPRLLASTRCCGVAISPAGPPPTVWTRTSCSSSSATRWTPSRPATGGTVRRWSPITGAGNIQAPGHWYRPIQSTCWLSNMKIYRVTLQTGNPQSDPTNWQSTEWPQSTLQNDPKN